MTILETVRERTAPAALISVPPLPQCQVSIIIPAKDEAQTIVATLTALAHQTHLDGQPLNPLTYEIIVLANNCSDDSAAIARQFAQQHPLVLHVAEVTLPPDLAYIGHVRKMLMDEAYLRLMSVGQSRGIIASTDGDTIVSATWIAAILHEIDSGVDAVGGRILTDRHSRQALHPQAKSHFLQEVGYRSLVAQVEFHLDPDPYDPLPRHYQHYGASLAVTVEMYAKAGGIPPVRTPEDEAFYQALLQVDARFRHSPLVQVTTSARVSGRSPVGLAAQLRNWTELSADSTLKVAPAAAMIDWFRLRRKLRSLWQQLLSDSKISVHEVELLAGKLGVSANWLFDELCQDHPFGKLFGRVTQCQHQNHLNHWQPIDVKVAIVELRQYLVTFNHYPVRGASALRNRPWHPVPLAIQTQSFPQL